MEKEDKISTPDMTEKVLRKYLYQINTAEDQLIQRRMEMVLVVLSNLNLTLHSLVYHVCVVSLVS